MYAVETLFLFATAALLVSQATRAASRRMRLALFGVGLFAAILGFALGQARVHMLPAALVFLVSSAFLLRRGYSPVALRVVGVALGLVLVALSVLVSLALPVVTLPAPDGPHMVGVRSFTLLDETRSEAAFGAPESAREIYVQVWYPGMIPDEGEPPVRTLWQELYRSAIGKIVFGYLSGMETHSFDSIQVAAAQARYPAVIFSPSLAGIAEQNTLLMEHLASHGYIVFGVTHPYFGMITAYPDGSGIPVSPSVMDAMSQQGAVDLDAIEARAEQAPGPMEQAAIRLEYFEQGEALNEFVEIWVRDLELLLDAVTAPSDASVPLAERVDTERIGLLGMSFGGGAITQLCKTDTRCRAAINLDGGLWGESMREPLNVPYLALASPANRPFFEHDLLTSRAPYYALSVDGAEHSNFTDVSAFVPLFEWLGITGPIEGGRVIEIMNVVSGRFFDAWLRDGRAGDLDFAEFPDISAESNRAPARVLPLRPR